MGRLAALLIVVSQLLLLWVVFDTTGPTSIWFTFVGHPLTAAGVALGIWVVTRRLLREGQEREAGGRQDH